MTKEQLADLVSSMRAHQKLREHFGEKYRGKVKECEAEVDEAIQNIIRGIW